MSARAILTAYRGANRITESTALASGPLFGLCDQVPAIMHPKRLAGLRKVLELKRDQLTATLAKTADASRAIGETVGGDEGEEAAAASNRDFLSAQGFSLREQLILVKDALIRLDTGEFGICEECGRAVNLKRLEAVPWTRYCRDCQQEVESEIGSSGER
ncbi:MAG: TraR/DksA family transcriptional regulator [Acidobacteriia bacterium]|nr:TraR/DksA family transcriptional regulator [Terriglobia bacterium]MYC66824.1 TraR/DksA family transcriptional regulator [Terriglobia bacterium]